MTKQPKSDEEIMAMAKIYRGDGATADELAAHEVGFRKAESELLPIIEQNEERIRELEGIIEGALEQLEDDNEDVAYFTLLKAWKGGE